MKNFFMTRLREINPTFVHSEEVTESWRIVDDLLCTGDYCDIRTTPYIYREGLWGPSHKVDNITKWDLHLRLINYEWYSNFILGNY